MRPGPMGPKVNKHHINHINHHPFTTTKTPVLLGNTSHINPCYLLENNATSNQVRFILEALTTAGGLIYILDAVREAQFLGYHTFTQNMMTVPSRVLFMCSCCIMMIMVPLRFTCSHQGEDISAVFVMLTTAPYFLFFCRGFRLVGPFVVMIYKMILTDLLCFVTIYIVFVLGFAQAMPRPTEKADCNKINARISSILQFPKQKGKDNMKQKKRRLALKSEIMTPSPFKAFLEENENDKKIKYRISLKMKKGY
ncbi:hypothetical protein AVEN_170312-1 [Araneus ventricosus]|uniref:Uncharacterized protein n=1 Tax=Araneus ventricosus TaxID=182803 RepID=A0A4Y2CBL6_ARAVE|nr:hypothetical protein AVEN_170312-1 [Araneus ventricosus]